MCAEDPFSLKTLATVRTQVRLLVRVRPFVLSQLSWVEEASAAARAPVASLGCVSALMGKQGAFVRKAFTAAAAVRPLGLMNEHVALEAGGADKAGAAEQAFVRPFTHVASLVPDQRSLTAQSLSTVVAALQIILGMRLVVLAASTERAEALAAIQAGVHPRFAVLRFIFFKLSFRSFLQTLISGGLRMFFETVHQAMAPQCLNVGEAATTVGRRTLEGLLARVAALVCLQHAWVAVAFATHLAHMRLFLS